jgi:predicted phage terminase large subunit-like protein
LERRRRTIASLPLLDFVPRVSPSWERPEHLAPITRLFERAMHDPVFALVSVPPQHGKTETIMHGVAWTLLRDPHITFAYASYAARFAESKSKIGRGYVLKSGIALRDDSASAHEWRTVAGGGMIATGIGGPLTGHGVQRLVIDDPHKNRAEAESLVMRDNVFDWCTSTAFTRLHPSASVFVVHTRWHEDDLIGRLSGGRYAERLRELGIAFEVVNLPAIADREGLGRSVGDALWPARRPLDFLHRQRALQGGENGYDWLSLYQGRPRPPGGAVFHDVHFYDHAPDTYRIGIGFDMAYTVKTRADYSCAVVLAESDGRYFVLDVRRMQCEAPRFAAELKQLKARYPGARMMMYGSTTELGAIDLLANESGLPATGQLARADKFVRAQPLAAAWNSGRVFVPHESPWLNSYVSEMASFTGADDPHDDQVDASAAAYDLLSAGAGAEPPRAFPSAFDPAPPGSPTPPRGKGPFTQWNL